MQFTISKFIAGVACAAAVSTSIVACTTAGASREEPSRPDPVLIHASQAAAEKRWVEGAQALDVERWVAGAQRRQLELFYEGVVRAEAEKAAAAQARWREAAARPRPSAPASSGRSSPPAGNVGGGCGGATNGADRYIGRESGGNPNARNPSGAWGCYQIMPGTWSSSCSDLGSHGSASTSAQAQCASRLPQNAWASSGPTG